jgi:hypothetical protein
MAGGSGANRARRSQNENAGQSQQPVNMRSPGGPAPYDGPANQTSSQHGDQPRENPYGPGLGYDPARPKPSVITNTRVELPVAAYALDTNEVSLISIRCSSHSISHFLNTPLLPISRICSILSSSDQYFLQSTSNPPHAFAIET